MESKISAYKRVGYFRDVMARCVKLDLTGTIYASPGVIKHIQKHHKNHFKKSIYNNLLEVMKKIVNSPDYIGVYKEDKGAICIELIKEINGKILVGIEFDNENKYIFVTTMYPISESKINKKLYEGRLVCCSDNCK